MGLHSYLKALDELGVEVACVTNHGDMSDFDELARHAPARLTIIPGVEISSIDGDFIFFSTDYDFLRSLEAAQPLPDRQERPAKTAAVWAHPFAGVAGGLMMGEEYIARVARQVDGIEIYNGNWPDEDASETARRVAADYGLAELGGSDAHRRESLMQCWTEVGEIESAGGLVNAILKRSTEAGR